MVPIGKAALGRVNLPNLVWRAMLNSIAAHPAWSSCSANWQTAFTQLFAYRDVDADTKTLVSPRRADTRRRL
jgi:hypothetical protein